MFGRSPTKVFYDQVGNKGTINVNAGIDELEFAGASLTVGRKFKRELQSTNYNAIFEYDKATKDVLITRKGILDCIELINPTWKHNRDARVRVVEELPSEVRRIESREEATRRG